MAPALTIVVPTFNRPQRVARLLEYLARVETTHRVLVADSSEPGTVEENRTAVRAIEARLRVEHHAFPADFSLFRKLAEIVFRVQTPFATVCADDDYMVPATIAKCAEHLAATASCAVAHGHSVVLVSKPELSSFYDGQRTFTYKQCVRAEVTPEERLRHHFQDYATTFCSVHRTAQLQHNMAAAEAHTRDYRFGEILPAALTMVQGQAHQVSGLYMIRVDSDVRLTNRATKGVMRTWGDLITRPDFSDRYKGYREKVLEAFGAMPTLQMDKAGELIDSSFAAFLTQHLAPRGTQPSDWRTVAKSLGRMLRLPSVTAAHLTSARRVRDALRFPKDVFRVLQTEANDELAIGRLLSGRSAFSRDFEPVWESLKRTPIGSIVG